MPAQTTPKGVAQSICKAVKDWIAAGQFNPGAALPSTRSLAAEWGVSRTTVTAAYEQLIAEGYIETRQGGRARVAHGVAGITTRRSALKTKLKSFVSPMSVLKKRHVCAWRITCASARVNS